MNYTMEYNEYRGTWNIYDVTNGEWYAEGTFEQMQTMMDNIMDCYFEEQESYCEGYDEY